MNTNGKSSKQLRAQYEHDGKLFPPQFQARARRNRKTHQLKDANDMVQKLTRSNVRLRAELNLLRAQPWAEAINNASLDCAREMTGVKPEAADAEGA